MGWMENVCVRSAECGVRSAECGVRSVENTGCGNEEYGKWRVWKTRSVENEECGNSECRK